MSDTSVHQLGDIRTYFYLCCNICGACGPLRDTRGAAEQDTHENCPGPPDTWWPDVDQEFQREEDGIVMRLKVTEVVPTDRLGRQVRGRLTYHPGKKNEQRRPYSTNQEGWKNVWAEHAV